MDKSDLTAFCSQLRESFVQPIEAGRTKLWDLWEVPISVSSIGERVGISSKQAAVMQKA